MDTSPLDGLSRSAVDRSSIKAILFDFGGTLDADGVAWKERFFRLYREKGVAVSSERFAQAFYKADDALVGRIPSDLPFGDTVTRLAQGVALELAVQDPAMVACITHRFIDDASKHLTAAAGILRRLSSRYRLGIVSNFYGNLSAVCREVGLSPFLAVVIDSTVAGVCKPNPEIFHAASRALQVEPPQVAFVGDSLQRDMAGARAVGMAHVWLTPEPFQDGEACCSDDPVIHGLEEVRALFA